MAAVSTQIAEHPATGIGARARAVQDVKAMPDLGTEVVADTNQ
jgi:hypothetical protein